jgi:hypothetical protein
MNFAKWVFRIAGVYGIVTIAPQYFLQDVIAQTTGPITHLEYFYGFVGLCLTWQFLFLLISRDPTRMRPAMYIAVLEKLSFGIPMFALDAAGRVPGQIAFFAGIDVGWAALFVAAILATRGSRFAVRGSPARLGARLTGD